MSESTLYCPFMGGNPCMGRSCACAVHERLCGQLVWWCGLVPGSSDNTAMSAIDKEDNK
jgi:hypothetical protein